MYFKKNPAIIPVPNAAYTCQVICPPTVAEVKTRETGEEGCPLPRLEVALAVGLIPV